MVMACVEMFGRVSSNMAPLRPAYLVFLASFRSSLTISFINIVFQMVCAKRVVAGLLLVSTGAAVANGACTGTSNGELPYSISSTKSGDGKSTTFYGLVCGLGCADGAVCADLTSVSIGGVSLGGGDGSDDCGTVYNVGLSPDGGCETFTFTADGSGVDLESVCPDGCHVRFNLANGESVVRTIGGARVETPVASPSPVPSPVPSPSPSPMPSPSPSPSPSVVPSSVPSSPTEEATPSASEGESVTPASIGSPRPYGGSVRRRNLHQYGGVRKLNQYGGAKRLHQY